MSPPFDGSIRRGEPGPVQPKASAKPPGRSPKGAPDQKKRGLLYVQAAEAVQHLLTFERRIAPTWDPEARKAYSVVDSVLRMFFGPRVVPGQADLLQRLHAVVDGSGLGEDERTRLALTIVAKAIRSFENSTLESNEKARRNIQHGIARNAAIALTLRTDSGWAPLIDDEEKVAAALALGLVTAGRRRATEVGVLAELSMGLRVLSMQPSQTIEKRRDVIQKRRKPRKPVKRRRKSRPKRLKD